MKNSASSIVATCFIFAGSLREFTTNLDSKGRTFNINSSEAFTKYDRFNSIPKRVSGCSWVPISKLNFYISISVKNNILKRNSARVSLTF